MIQILHYLKHPKLWGLGYVFIMGNAGFIYQHNTGDIALLALNPQAIQGLTRNIQAFVLKTVETLSTYGKALFALSRPLH